MKKTVKKNTAVEGVEYLGSMAVLVDLDLPGYDPNKLDKKATDDTCRRTKSSVKRVKVIKKLLTETGSIEYIQHRLLTDLHDMTAPWKRGQRIMSVESVDKFNAKAYAAKKELFEKLEGFRPNYEEAINVKAKEELGDMWDLKDYLSFEEFKQQWDIIVNWEPVPSTGHFIVDAQKKTVDSLTQSLAGAITNRYGNISRDLWSKMYKATAKIVERLSGEKLRFREDKEIMQSLRDLLELLPVLNLTRDGKLTSTMEEVKAKIADVSNTDLLNEKKKDKVVKDAKKLLDEMDKYIEAPPKRALEF